MPRPTPPLHDVSDNELIVLDTENIPVPIPHPPSVAGVGKPLLVLFTALPTAKLNKGNKDIVNVIERMSTQWNAQHTSTKPCTSVM